MTFRMNYAHGQISRNNVLKDRIGTVHPSSGNGRRFYPELAHVSGVTHIRPPLPPRNPIPNYTRNPNTHPASQYGVGPQNNQWNLNGYRPQNPVPVFQRPNNQPQYQNPGYSKPTIKTEPMDVDRSIQSKQVNYMNRPQIYQNTKRPAGSSFQGPVNKFQRNFHMVAENESAQGINHVPQYYEYGPEEGAVGGITEVDEYYREFTNSGIETFEQMPETSELEKFNPIEVENLSGDLANDPNFFG